MVNMRKSWTAFTALQSMVYYGVGKIAPEVFKAFEENVN
jgi:hypothetical protein